MSDNYYLAVDIGASSGRCMLGRMNGDKLELEEVHRFPNGYFEKDGNLIWNIDGLFEEIIAVLIKCSQMGIRPVSISVDTWGVDFVLLDKSNKRLGDAVCYRDSRTNNIAKFVYERVDKDYLFSQTGIAYNVFNTIFQLMAIYKNELDVINNAETLLMIPDYLHYSLCGNAVSEYTIASTTGLLNAYNRNWDDEIIRLCNFPRKIFPKVASPGTIVGRLTDEIIRKVGFSCKVVLPASHDTASAIVAVPSTSESDSTMYISSGTWSLMGIEREKPDCSKLAARQGFTNEGGFNNRVRFLKNIMGLWMIQSIRKELNNAYTYAQLDALAANETIAAIVDCADDRFLAPKSMINTIKHCCIESGQQPPKTPGELAAVIYNSLAKCYKSTADELEAITNKHFATIHIIGGGANAEYLNKLTAKITGKTILSGPTEATAVGNLAVQMISNGEIKNLNEARRIVEHSFDIKRSNPLDTQFQIS
ncbi:MAG: rhamnulokinase [Clostridiales bacterium]|nr:rhamnulokinase [Clostridiales bacterium]